VARRVFRGGPLLTRLLQHHRPTICPFHELLRYVPTDARVLDIGCGGGLLLALLAATRSPSELTGIDSSRRAIAVAQANLERFGMPLPRLFLLDANAPWPVDGQGGYDTVILCDVLHHVPAAAQRLLLERAGAAVAPGGVLVYKDIYPEGLVRPNASRLHDLLIARERIAIPRIADVVGAVTGAGLGLEHVQRINMLWYGHELAVFRRPAVAAEA